MSVPGVLVAGNYTSAWKAGHRAVCEDLADRLEGRGQRVVRASGVRFPPARLADLLWTALRRRGDYDVAKVDVYSGRAFVWADALCGALRLLGRPYVLALRGGNLPAFAARHPGRVRALLGGAAAVTAPSEYLVEAMAPYRAGIRLLPNPLDLARYPFRLRETATPRLVWVRTYGQIYNPALAVRALAELRREVPDATLRMAGYDRRDGALEAARAAAREAGIEDAVEIGPGVPKERVGEALSAGDVYLSTPDIDNTPVTVMEAMACGLCVVATRVGGLPHLVRDGEDALLVPANDPAAMAAAVRRVLVEPGLSGALSGAARRRAEAWDWGGVLPLWESLLDEVRHGAAARPRPVPSSPAADR